MKLQVIIGSTRTVRVGDKIAKQFVELAKKYTSMDIELIDLAEVNLPSLDEPKTPSQGDYQLPHTKAWASKIAEGDAYVIVTPEYNHGYPAPLKNALDYLSAEWHHKPVGFVSYGGVSAGTRAVEQLRLVAVELKLVPIKEAVHLSLRSIKTAEGAISLADPHVEASVELMMKELVWMATALKNAR